jgi:hypothetical protein
MIKSTIEVSMQKALSKSVKMASRLRISKFSSFIHYIVGYFDPFRP